MKVSLSWLREWVPVEASADEVAQRLTLAGLEVEGVTRLGEATGVRVAELVAVRPHPKADALRLVRVRDGREEVEVVCGAPTLPPVGARVAWAAPGARLPGIGEVAPKPVRGVVSPGMLCAEDELGLSEDHDGLLVLSSDAALGSDALLPFRDVVLELNVTPNRPDCLGHVGVAREVAALFGLRRRSVEPPAIGAVSGPAPRVEVEDAQGCPRYVALVLGDLAIGPSPPAVQRRLKAVGIRPISNVVDATNYVLAELGQPLHAFDLDRLEGERIVVRRARGGETIKTLDGALRKLAPSDLVIADAARPVALAGVMGGADSEVTASTRRILLESAYFDPATIRRAAKRLGLSTEASHRFERGVDPSGTRRASERAAELLGAWAGAKPRGPLSDLYPRPVAPVTVTLGRGAVRRLLGVDLDDAATRTLLESIELQVAPTTGGFSVTVPTFRPDLGREVDLIEEVARLYGYDRFPATLPATVETHRAGVDARGDRVRDLLVAQGLSEVVTFGFLAPSRIEALGLPPSDPRSRPMLLVNPLREETGALRTSLLPGLLSVLRLNLDRGATHVEIFEVGAVFLPRDGEAPEERKMVGLLLAGGQAGWLGPGRAFDLFDLKGIAEQLSSRLGCTSPEWTAETQHPLFHPGVAARIGSLGVAGEVHPALRRRAGVEVPCFYLELDLAALPPEASIQVAPLPRFPAVDRDVSFFIDADVPAAVIRGCIAEVGEPLLVEVQVREDYRDPAHVPEGKKGMLFSMTYRAADRTLTDQEVGTAHTRLCDHLRQRLGIALR